jgi:hypothetical protein
VEPAIVAPPTVESRKKRGAGIWSFVLGLIAVLGDIAVVIFVVVSLFAVFSAFSAGDIEALATGLQVAGLGFVLIVAFVGGFVLAVVGALLGLIAVFGGRGRIIGIFGLLLSAAAIAVRVSILLSGFDVASLG